MVVTYCAVTNVGKHIYSQSKLTVVLLEHQLEHQHIIICNSRKGERKWDVSKSTKEPTQHYND